MAMCDLHIEGTEKADIPIQFTVATIRVIDTILFAEQGKLGLKLEVCIEGNKFAGFINLPLYRPTAPLAELTNRKTTATQIVKMLNVQERPYGDYSWQDFKDAHGTVLLPKPE